MKIATREQLLAIQTQLRTVTLSRSDFDDGSTLFSIGDGDRTVSFEKDDLPLIVNALRGEVG